MIISDKQAVKLLLENNVIATITDTVYGLAASPHSIEALSEIFRLKKRPLSQTLPLLGADLTAFAPFVSQKNLAKIAPLAKAFWPGALTIVVPTLSTFPYITQDATIAIRIPDCPPLLELLKMTGPLATTSANLSGSPPLLTEQGIEECFGNDFPLFSPPFECRKIPSTILKIEENGYSIVRKGAILESEIKEKIRW